MKHDGQPETESEYWEMIEGLGGLSYNTARGIRRGHIEETVEIREAMAKWGSLQLKYAEEIAQKFGVIMEGQPPRSEADTTPAPEGKKWYWCWFDEMKRKAYSADYEKLICSACPLSEGLDEMIVLGGSIPCSAFTGSMYRLSRPWVCGMIHCDGWTEEKLLSEIRAKTGDDGVKIYLEKKEALTPKKKPL